MKTIDGLGKRRARQSLFAVATPHPSACADTFSRKGRKKLWEVAVLVLSFAAALSTAAAQAEPVRVRVDSGVLVGEGDGQVSAFKGVPYVAAPLGDLRWRPPQPVRRWTGDRVANAFGPVCPQQPAAAMLASAPQSEDCLTLNVWAPAHADHAPVMVWVHGGGFDQGGAADPFYDGAAFARDGVVLVSFNYRLGALGWFAHPALTKAAKAGEPVANYGLMDQIAALQWVKRNIAAFGGDPARVTIFGESAGGSAVMTLLTVPSARGLFAQAIAQSAGFWTHPGTLAQREAAGAKAIADLGLQDPTAADLRALPVDRLPRIWADVAVDGRLVQETPAAAILAGHADHVPLLIGTNSDEGSIIAEADPAETLSDTPPGLLALYAGLADDKAKARAIFRDRNFTAPARWAADRLSGGAPVFAYRFSYIIASRRDRYPGANHGAEIPFVFDTSHARGAEDQATMAMVHACWVSFVRTGAPACPPAPAWPAYDGRDEAVMDFGLQPSLTHHLDSPTLDAYRADIEGTK